MATSLSSYSFFTSVDRGLRTASPVCPSHSHLPTFLPAVLLKNSWFPRDSICCEIEVSRCQTCSFREWPQGVTVEESSWSLQWPPIHSPVLDVSILRHPCSCRHWARLESWGSSKMNHTWFEDHSSSDSEALLWPWKMILTPLTPYRTPVFLFPETSLGLSHGLCLIDVSAFKGNSVDPSAHPGDTIISTPADLAELTRKTILGAIPSLRKWVPSCHVLD